ncbi:hypothetical protein [Caulobacter sp. HMWF025]|uniref:hypothetical protein n=2 Tax=unclassified Caulobacter TaxID=2648921 RepID=UPI001E337FB0|nr:hypothetical protein [Caulobacter sp. HMWF025]
MLAGLGGAPLSAGYRPLDGFWTFVARAGLEPDSALERRLPGLRRLGARPYGILGDSHGRHLIRRGQRHGTWLAPLAHLASSASARGLGRADGRSGTGPKVAAALERLLAIDDLPILMKFGQVDIEFVQVFKRLAAGEDRFSPEAFDAFADETIALYVAFLAGVVPAAQRSRVRVLSLFPPALSDDSWREGYLNAHMVAVHGPPDTGDLTARLGRLDIPNLAQRTALHAAFNERLQAAVEVEGFRWGDDFSPWLGGDGLLDPAWLGPAAGRDHHLDLPAARWRALDWLWPILE